MSEDLAMIWKAGLVLCVASCVLGYRPAVSEQKLHLYHHGDLKHIGEQVPEHHEVYAWAYPSYEFSYHVDDPHTHDFKGQHEIRDGDKVTGKYWLMQPDGRKRTVKYSSDHKKGFHAEVKYTPHEGHHPHHYKVEEHHPPQHHMPHHYEVEEHHSEEVDHHHEIMKIHPDIKEHHHEEKHDERKEHNEEHHDHKHHHKQSWMKPIPDKKDHDDEKNGHRDEHNHDVSWGWIKSRLDHEHKHAHKNEDHHKHHNSEHWKHGVLVGWREGKDYHGDNHHKRDHDHHGHHEDTKGHHEDMKDHHEDRHEYHEDDNDHMDRHHHRHHNNRGFKPFVPYGHRLH